MAKENYVFLRGQLRQDVKYVANEEGDVKKVIFRLTVLRRDTRDRANNFSPKFDRPIVASEDPEIIRATQGFKKGDIIEVKGFYKTKHITKHCKCPNCESVNGFNATFPTVCPIYVGRCAELETSVEGTDYLKNCAEVSNVAKVIGRVCINDDDFVYAETDRGDRYAKYQIAVNRKFYDSTAVDAEDHADYPIVYSYNDVADQDKAMLKQGALIYLDGYLHTMKYDAEVECFECGQTFNVPMQRMNLTPYSNEYLRDYKTDGLASTHKEAVEDPGPMHDGDLG